MAETHREDDDYGWIGEAQAAWFAERLRPFEEAGWLRIGAVRHDPMPGAPGPTTRRAARRRHADACSADRLNLLVHGPGRGGSSAGSLGARCCPCPARRRAAPDPPAHRGRPAPLRPARWTAPAGEHRSRERLERQLARRRRTRSPRRPPPRPRRPQRPPPPTADERAGHSPAALLLDRIAEICETRPERARLRRIDGDAAPPARHAPGRRASSGSSGSARAVGEPSPERRRRVPRSTPTPPTPTRAPSWSTTGPAPAAGAAGRRAAARGVRLRSFTEFQGLLDLRRLRRRRRPHGCAPTGSTRRSCTCRSASASWTRPRPRRPRRPRRRDAGAARRRRRPVRAGARRLRAGQDVRAARVGPPDRRPSCRT